MAKKSESILFVVTPDEKELIRKAAEAQDRSMSYFVGKAAVKAAREQLGEEDVIVR